LGENDRQADDTGSDEALTDRLRVEDDVIKADREESERVPNEQGMDDHEILHELDLTIKSRPTANSK
jgi:hypothetical protein